MAKKSVFETLREKIVKIMTLAKKINDPEKLHRNGLQLDSLQLKIVESSNVLSCQEIIVLMLLIACAEQYHVSRRNRLYSK
ncbi:MAG: hypothetical protein HQ402_02655 [Parcubacteria group bacterium]|nr:hypothetical protein [Parcubacteria group bacterium]